MKRLIVMLAAILLTPAVALAGATLTVKALRDSPSAGQTQFQMEVCVCFAGADWVAWVDGGFQVRVEIPEPGLEVTENDFWDDDELGAFGAVIDGTYVVPVWPAGNGPCPPSPPSCASVGAPFPTGGVPSSSYGNENPADFQLGKLGGEEGSVPPGTTVKFGPGMSSSTTPSCPNSSS